MVFLKDSFDFFNPQTAKSRPLVIHRIFKRLTKALIRLHLLAGWSEPLLVAHTTLLEISCRSSNEVISCVPLFLLSLLRSIRLEKMALFLERSVTSQNCCYCLKWGAVRITGIENIKDSQI